MILFLRSLIFLWSLALLLTTLLLTLTRPAAGTHALIAYAAPSPRPYGAPIHDSLIYRMWADGTPFDTLTVAGQIHTLPAWSADGRWLSYVTPFSTTGDQLRVMRSGGGRSYALSATDLEYNLAAQWSPVTAHFLIAGRNVDGQKVYAGAPDQPLERPLINVAGNHRPVSWSPDGNWIVLTMTRGVNLVIYRARADGSDPQPLTALDGVNYDPHWTKDGAWIVYTSGIYDNIDIYRMRPDGSDVQRLTSRAAPEHYPNLSPDGQWVLYLVNEGVETIPYLMHPDGSAAHPLSADWQVPVPLDIAWSPDSQWITFIEAGLLYRIRVDGTGLAQLTHDVTCCATWSPAVDLPLRISPLLGLGVLGLTAGGIIRQRERKSR